MTKAELAARVADKVHLTNRQSEAVINIVLRCIAEALREGDKVELRGFGSFRTRSRNARQGRNPRTGEAVQVPSKRVPFFKGREGPPGGGNAVVGQVVPCPSTARPGRGSSRFRRASARHLEGCSASLRGMEISRGEPGARGVSASNSAKS